MKAFVSTLFVSAVAASLVELDLHARGRPHRGHHGCSRVQQQCAGAQAESAYQWCPHNAHTVTVTHTAARTTSTVTSTSTASASTTTTTTITVLPTCTQATPVTKKRNAARKAQQLVKKGQTGGAPSCLGPSPWEACSCLHPTTTTITVTPSVALTTTLTTITSTATLTSTETVQGPFNIMGVQGTKTQGFPIASSAPDFAVGTTPQSGGGFPFVSYDSTSADAFYLTSNGTLLDSTFTDANGNPYIAFQYTDFSTPEGGNAPVTIAPGSTVYSSGGYQPLVCFLDPNNCRLDCRANGNENNFQCYYNYLNEWYIAPSPVSPSQCYVFSPQITYGAVVL